MGIQQMTIQAGVLILATVVLRAVALNKLPNKAFLLLWGIAIARLLVPFSLRSVFSIYNLWARAANAGPANGTPQFMEALLPYNGAGAGDNQAGAQPMPRQKPVDPWVLVWVIGVLLVAVFLLIGYVRTQRRLRFAVRIDGNKFIDQWLCEHQLRRPIAILQSDRIRTPIAYGYIRPRIVLPKSLDLKDEQLLGHVLTHELYHIRHFHAVWKLIAAAALCIHWFNPMAWVMVKLLNQDLEIACDQGVLRHFGADSRKAYAYSLIGMAEQRGTAGLLLCGFSKNAAEERITAIMKFKKTSIIATAVALVVVLGATVVFVTSGVVEGNTESASSAGSEASTRLPSGGEDHPITPSVETPEERPTPQVVTYESVSMQRYAGEDGHPYVHSVISNNTDKTITGQQFGMLAYDADGNPLKIRWNLFDNDAEPSYFYLCTWGESEVAADEIYDGNGGWSLNYWGDDENAEQIAYVLYCDKVLAFEDGSVWENPDFDAWRAEYEGNSIDVTVLEGYYPFSQVVA